MSRLLVKLVRLAFVISLTGSLAVQQAERVRAQTEFPQNPLPEPHGYLVTGNYAVGSFDFPAQSAKGTVNGTIHISTCPNPQTNPPTGNCVPSNADVLAAYLYWEMIDVNPQATNIKFQDQSVVDPRVS